MSSLRLALKLSMEDGVSAPAPAPAPEAPKEKAPPKRKRSESTASLKGDGGSENVVPVKKKDSSSAPKDVTKKKSSSEKSASSTSEKKSGEGKSKSEGSKKKDGTDKLADGGSKKERVEKAERKHDSDKKDSDHKDKESSHPKKKKNKESGDRGAKGESVANGNGTQTHEGGDDSELQPKTQSKKKKESGKDKEKKANEEDDMDLEDDDGSKDNDDEAIEEEVVVPRYQSSRAAAQVAKDKLSAKGFKASINEEYAPVSHSKPRQPKSAPSLPSQWVQCDKCTKWRSIPGSVDMDTLPEQWYCSMNKWDSSRRSCTVKEETATADEGDGDGEDALDESGDGGGTDDTYTIGITGGVPKEPRRRGGGGQRAAEAAAIALAVVEKVNWVQCNRCNKWRKAPLSIDPESLPDVWHCAMNHWAPHMAKCSIKEEEDDEPDPLTLAAFGGPTGAGGGSGTKSRRQSGAGGTPLTVNSAVKKKVVQWVQCERKNCKKWRKLPGHVELSTLPEKWYCEMNQWDLDRANCDVPDDSDEEVEEKNTVSSQLITANTKGPSALSYRRIIFGTDGKVRPVYNEKNKNGYGIFSYSESRRHAEKHGNPEENVEPTSRLSYWWTSVYDETGAIKQRAEAARKPTTGTGRGRHHLHKDKNATSEAAIEKVSESSVADTSEKGSRSQEKSDAGSVHSSSPQQPPKGATDGAAAEGQDKQSVEGTSEKKDESDTLQDYKSRAADPSTYHLLQTARRMGGWDAGGSGRPYPVKHCKANRQNDSSSFMRKERAASTIVRSCLTSVGQGKQIPLNIVMRIMDTAYFHSAELESVRRTMNMQTLKGALKQLETQGEVDITMNEGHVCITLCPTYKGNSTEAVAKQWRGEGVPLKLRKCLN